MDGAGYLEAMCFISHVAAEGVDPDRRSIVIGSEAVRGGVSSQLVVELACDERERIIGCDIDLVPRVGGERYRVVSIPAAVLVADAANTLPPDVRELTRAGDVIRLATAVGDVLGSAALLY